jgi:hypothetical protein
MEDQARKAWAAWQALSMELMETMDIPGKHDDGTIDLVRTESKEVLAMNKVVIGGSGDSAKKMLHTPLDCSSAGTCVIVYGSEITLYQNVPFHRIAGGYFMVPYSDFWHTPSEHAALFNPEGLPFTYVGTAKRDPSLAPINLGTKETPIDHIMRTTFHMVPAKNSKGHVVYVAQPNVA